MGFTTVELVYQKLLIKNQFELFKSICSQLLDITDSEKKIIFFHSLEKQQ